MSLQSILDFLNSNFSTAMFGAIFGSLTVLLIEWVHSQRKILADINGSIAVLSGLLNTYLMIKRQHSLPLAQNYRENVRKLSNVPKAGPPNIQVYLKRFLCPGLHVDLPLDRIFTLADKHSGVIPLLMQAKRAVGDVEDACDIWNKLTVSFQEMTESDRQQYYLGGHRFEGIQDTNFADTVNNLEKSVDDALFFTDLAIRGMMKVGKKALPFWLRKKVSKIEIVGEEHRVLMLPSNYKKGWDLENI